MANPIINLRGKHYFFWGMIALGKYYFGKVLIGHGSLQLLVFLFLGDDLLLLLIEEEGF